MQRFGAKIQTVKNHSIIVHNWGLDLSKEIHESPKQRWKVRERQVTSRSVLLLPSDTLHLKALPEASGHSHLKRKFCFGSIEVNWSIDGLKHKPWSKTLKIFEIISNFGKYITSTQTFLLSASSEKTKTITTTLRLLFYVEILWLNHFKVLSFATVAHCTLLEGVWFVSRLSPCHVLSLLCHFKWQFSVCSKAAAASFMERKS